MPDNFIWLIDIAITQKNIEYIDWWPKGCHTN